MRVHLTEAQARAYRDRSLTASELLLASDHLAACEECRARISSSEAVHESVENIRKTLVAEAAMPAHLTYDELAAYVDGTLEEASASHVKRHARECESCATNLNDFAALKREIKAPAKERADGSRLWRWSMAWKGGLAFAGAAVCALLLITARQPQRRTEAPGRPAPPSLAASAILSTIRDGDRVFAIGSDGRISGIDALGPSERTTIEQAIMAKRVELAPAPPELRGKRGVLLGSSNDAPTVELLAPSGTLVESERPVFRWKAESGATYQVSVFDSGFDTITSSNWIDGTEWSAAKSLRRGVRYSWQLTVRRNGAEFTLPAPPDPEAHFQILSAAAEAELNRLRSEFPGSHLVLGIFYAKAGLETEAILELRKLNDENPGSETTAALLGSIESSGFNSNPRQ
jgi:anti-sigma factor ChrR (cupin superfamily)